VVRVAAPEAAENQTAEERKSEKHHKGEEPMVYADEQVNFGDGAVVKVRTSLDILIMTTPRIFQEVLTLEFSCWLSCSWAVESIAEQGGLK